MNMETKSILKKKIFKSLLKNLWKILLKNRKIMEVIMKEKRFTFLYRGIMRKIWYSQWAVRRWCKTQWCRCKIRWCKCRTQCVCLFISSSSSLWLLCYLSRCFSSSKFSSSKCRSKIITKLNKWSKCFWSRLRIWSKDICSCSSKIKWGVYKVNSNRIKIIKELRWWRKLIIKYKVWLRFVRGIISRILKFKWIVKINLK